MTALIINTVSNPAFVLLANEKKIIDKFFLDNKYALSKNLLGEIKKLLERNNISFKKLSFIGTCTGPGSFTGIRVGAAIAKGFSFAVKIPIIPFFSLEGLLHPKATAFISLIEDKDQIYYSKGNTSSGLPIFDLPKAIKREHVKKLFDCNLPFVFEQCSFKDQMQSFYKTSFNHETLVQTLFDKFQKKNWIEDCKLPLFYLKEPKLIDK